MDIAQVNELIHKYYPSRTLIESKIRSSVDKFKKNKDYVVISDIENNIYVIEKKRMRKKSNIQLLEDYLMARCDTMYCALVRHKRKIRALYFDPRLYSEDNIIDVDMVEEEFDCRFLT